MPDARTPGSSGAANDATNDTTKGAADDARLDRGTILALGAMAIAVFVVANDFTALSVAIPKIEQDLETTLSSAQWVINGYALTFGVRIVSGGRLADLFGRRRIFMIGATIFACFSVLGGLAPSIGVLVACRVLMGVGGALMWPAVLGLTYALLPESKAGLAGGLVLGVAGFGNAIGPLLGGFLTDTFSWRLVFFINLPIAVLAMVVTRLEVPESRADTDERSIDYAGIATLSTGLVLVLLALDEGGDEGWTSPLILTLFGAAALLLIGFALIERRAGQAALVPRDVLRNRDFAAACGSVLMMSAIFFSALLFLPQYMTKDLGWSAVGSGFGLLPLMVTFAAASLVAGPLYNRAGPKVMVTTGAVCLTVGIFWLSFLDDLDGIAGLIPGMVILGVGVGFFYSSITTAGVTALDPSRSSLAGGILYMCQVAGGAIGLGFNTAIVTAGDSLTAGISTAFRIDAALGVVGLVIAFLFVGGAVQPERIRALRGHHRAHA